MSLTMSKCVFCKNLIEDDEKLICSAFPDEIPDEVFWSDEDEECKEGIKFEKID